MEQWCAMHAGRYATYFDGASAPAMEPKPFAASPETRASVMRMPRKVLQELLRSGVRSANLPAILYWQRIITLQIMITIIIDICHMLISLFDHWLIIDWSSTDHWLIINWSLIDHWHHCLFDGYGHIWSMGVDVGSKILFRAAMPYNFRILSGQCWWNMVVLHPAISWSSWYR